MWSKDLKIRFGNGFECWNIAEDVEVTNCYFYNIFDSGVTHQGSDTECQPCKNVFFNNNVFVKCGMGAYEQRDRLPLYATFNNNICILAGEGFSKQGEIMPRYSEIWPRPMGHHLFLWRIKKATEGGKLEVKNNIFAGAPYGASIYSIISDDAQALIDLEGNVYCCPDDDLLVNHICGTDYKSFKEYVNAGIEKNPVEKKVDVSEYLKH